MSTFRQKVQATTQWMKPDPDGRDEVDAKRRRSRSGRPNAAAQPPVTAHRLFPAFAALWFAALFGLGSLAISGAALGSLVTAIGLPALVPAARPPLGFTAHVLVAFALTLVGAALGLAIALRLRPGVNAMAEPAAPAPAPAPESEADDGYKVRARDAHPDAPPRRPLVLTEAFGDAVEPADAAPAEPEPSLLRRKPGLVVSEVLASEAASREAGPWIAEFAPGGVHAVQPLDLSALDLGEVADASLEYEEQAAEDAGPVAFQPAPALEVNAPPESDAAVAAPIALVEAPAVLAPAIPPLIAATPQLPAGFSAALPDIADGAWSPVAGASLESLGLVQLIERLALAIAARKAADDAAAMAAASEADVEPVADIVPAEPEFAPRPFSRPLPPEQTTASPNTVEAPPIGSAREAILRRLGAIAAGDAETAESPLRFERPARLVSQAPETSAQVMPTMAAPQSASEHASAPFEADDALRSALATLQRMTARG